MTRFARPRARYEGDRAKLRFGKSRHGLLDAARPWLDAGDATLRDGQLAIPAERFLLSDAVIGALFEADD